MFRLAFAAASQPSVACPNSTCAHGEATWRPALPTALEVVLPAWELLAVLQLPSAQVSDAPELHGASGDLEANAGDG